MNPSIHKDFREIATYGHDTVTALGVVSIRAGQMDTYLCHFLTAIAFERFTNFRMAQAFYYSTRNTKARSDMIRAAIRASLFSDERKEFALSLLKRADDMAAARNKLIHGQFTSRVKTA
jgi:hypothetical protein